MKSQKETKRRKIRIEKKKKKTINIFSALVLSIIFTLSLIPITIAQEDTTSELCDIGEVYLEGKGCIKPQFNADFMVYPAPEGKISSSLGEVQAIRINNPYAAAGQPVVIEFTLENIGDQLGYPFDKIDLPADVFALQLAVDKDLMVITSDGRKIDIWGMMSGLQKVGFLLETSTEQFYNVVKDELQGRTCGYIDITNNLPDVIYERLVYTNNQKQLKIYSWNCIKIVDMPLFKEEIKSYCGNKIDSACIADLNQRFSNSVNDIVTVSLSSEKESGLRKGECRRPYMGGFLNYKELWGTLKGKANIVECSIGDKGLRPGEQVTFRFVALVPADTPALNPEALSQLDEIKEFDGDLFGGYTQSASCIDSSNPLACHTIYGAVTPIAKDTLLSYLAGGVGASVHGLMCGGKKVWDWGGTDLSACLRTGSQGVRVIGEPIWEGQGIFFVLAPALSASITMILWGIYVAGALTPYMRKSPF